MRETWYLVSVYQHMLMLQKSTCFVGAKVHAGALGMVLPCDSAGCASELMGKIALGSMALNGCALATLLVTASQEAELGAENTAECCKKGAGDSDFYARLRTQMHARMRAAALIQQRTRKIRACSDKQNPVRAVWVPSLIRGPIFGVAGRGRFARLRYIWLQLPRVVSASWRPRRVLAKPGGGEVESMARSAD